MCIRDRPESSSAFALILTVANGFTNSGTIRLAGSGLSSSSFSSLAVTTGVVTNSGSGVMHFQSGGVSSRGSEISPFSIDAAATAGEHR